MSNHIGQGRAACLVALTVTSVAVASLICAEPAGNTDWASVVTHAKETLSTAAEEGPVPMDAAVALCVGLIRRPPEAVSTEQWLETNLHPSPRLSSVLAASLSLLAGDATRTAKLFPPLPHGVGWRAVAAAGRNPAPAGHDLKSAYIGAGVFRGYRMFSSFEDWMADSANCPRHMTVGSPIHE